MWHYLAPILIRADLYKGRACGSTVLHAAAFLGRRDMVEWLIKEMKMSMLVS